MTAGVTSAGRRAAESLMLDAGKALRPTGSEEYDPDADGGQGANVPMFDDLFESKCKVQTRALVAQEVEVGGRTSTSVRTELHLPADTAPLTVGDVWEITVAHPVSLAIVGQRLRVTAPTAGSLKTARRYVVEEVLS